MYPNKTNSYHKFHVMKFAKKCLQCCFLLLLLLNVTISSFCQNDISNSNSIVDTSITNININNKKTNDTSKVIHQVMVAPFYFKEVHPKSKNRIRLVTAGNIAGYGLAMAGFYSAWYKDYPQSGFHFFNDNKEWLQVDKVGHMYGAYIESKGSMEMWKWAGLPRKQRIWIGGLSGAVYQTVIETLDGFSAEWGWSWGDFTANILGSSLLVSQELLWDEQRVDLKFSFHRKDYGESMLNTRADSLYGKNILNRMIKDYNGQTYWLSANLKSFFPKSNLPAWLNVAVGYGAEGMFGAEENRWKNSEGNYINRYDIERYRQWYIAPDINFTKIKTKSKFLKATFFVLNSFKFPLPSIGFSKKGVEWNWLHF